MQHESTIEKGKVEITLFFEGNTSDKNFSVYIPELRLGLIGDTYEEAREQAIDLAKSDKKRLLKGCQENSHIVERIELEIE